MWHSSFIFQKKNYFFHVNRLLLRSEKDATGCVAPCAKRKFAGSRNKLDGVPKVAVIHREAAVAGSMVNIAIRNVEIVIDSCEHLLVATTKATSQIIVVVV